MGKQYEDILKAHPLFKGLSGFDVQNFVSRAEHVKFNPGTVVIHAGDKG